MNVNKVFLLLFTPLNLSGRYLELVPTAVTSGSQISACVGWSWGSDAWAFQPISKKVSFQMCVYENEGTLRSSKRVFKHVVSELTISCVSTNRTSLMKEVWGPILEAPSILKNERILHQGYKIWYIFKIFVLNKFMLFPQQTAMTTRMIVLDSASSNYWLDMCQCEADAIKGRGHREGGWVLDGVTEPLNHTSPEIFW